MKKLLVLLIAMIASPSFAIFGLGAHWAPSGHYIARNVDTLSALPADLTNLGNISFVQGNVSNMQGFGLKFYVDIIPVIDIETSFNMNFGRYAARLDLDPEVGPTQQIDVNPDFDFAGFEVPNYFQAVWDVSVNYPVADIIPMVTPYVGGGFSYFAGTPVADKEFLEGILTDNPTLLNPEGGLDPEAAGLAIAEHLVKQGYNSAVGGHAMVGARVKPPIIPFAVYANTKYYFGDLGQNINQGALYELGLALAI